MEKNKKNIKNSKFVKDLKSDYFIMVPAHFLLGFKNVSVEAKYCFLHIIRYGLLSVYHGNLDADGNPIAFMKQATLAEEIGVSRFTILRYLDELEKAKLIKRITFEQYGVQKKGLIIYAPKGSIPQKEQLMQLSKEEFLNNFGIDEEEFEEYEKLHQMLNNKENVAKPKFKKGKVEIKVNPEYVVVDKTTINDDGNKDQELQQIENEEVKQVDDSVAKMHIENEEKIDHVAKIQHGMLQKCNMGINATNLYTSSLEGKKISDINIYNNKIKYTICMGADAHTQSSEKLDSPNFLDVYSEKEKVSPKMPKLLVGINTSNPEELVEVIKKKTEEKHLEKMEKKSSKPKKEVRNAVTLCDKFNYLIKDRLETIPAMITKKELKLAKELIEYYGYDKVEEVIEWVIENWDRFKKEKKLDGIPNIPLIFGFRSYLFSLEIDKKTNGNNEEYSFI